MADSKPLKILIIGYGGGEITFLSRLVKGLADAGLQLSVTSPKRTNPLLLKHPNIHRLKTPPWEGPIIGRIFNLILLILTRFSFQRLGWLKNQVQRGKNQRERLVYLNRYLPFMRGEWDVIYFPWNSAAIGYRGLYDLDTPVVVSCRGSQINIRPHMPGQDDYLVGLRETLQKASAMHCVSADIQREAQKYGLDPKKSVVINPAVDPDFFCPNLSPTKRSSLQITTTGSLIWGKGYEYLLMAFQILIHEEIDAELHIIGRSTMDEAVRFTIHDLGLDGKVHLHGRLTPDQILQRLQQSDIFVLSSLSEGLSNAVLEAMSCGLPVVTTDCGGMAEAVTDGVEGFLVPIRDPHSLAEALVKLAEDPALRKRMGTASRERVLRDFQLKEQINDFNALFRQVIDHP